METVVLEASFFVRMSWQIKIDLHYVVSDRVTLLVNSLEKNGKEILLCGIIKSYNKNTKKKEAMLLVLQSLVYTGIKILDLYTMYLNILPQTGNKVTLSKMCYYWFYY